MTLTPFKGITLKNCAKGIAFVSPQKLEDEDYYSYIDQVALNFFGSNVTGFSVIRGSLLNVQAAYNRRDVRETYCPPPRIAQRAESLLTLMHGHLIERHDVTPINGIELVGKTSAGFPYSRSCKNKEEFVRKFIDYIRWYVREEYNRPVPIWKLSPKIEYKPLSKIAERKIRIFTFPPADFLILQKILYQSQEKVLLTYDRRTPSALGFVKEGGGWNSMVLDLLRFKHLIRLDISNFDQHSGVGLGGIAQRLRNKFFTAEAYTLNKPHIDFVQENTICAALLTYWGQVIDTVMSTRSGELLTSTDNTIKHLFMLLCRYVEHTFEKGGNPTLKNFNEVCCCYVYADDLQCSTNDPELFGQSAMTRLYGWFGMGVKEYQISENPESIAFLGARNARFTILGVTRWVPIFDEARMMCALMNVGGELSDRLRAERITGFIHLLCFSDFANRVEAFAIWLKARGRWPSDLPIVSVFQARASYFNLESLPPGATHVDLAWEAFFFSRRF